MQLQNLIKAPPAAELGCSRRETPALPLPLCSVLLLLVGLATALRLRRPSQARNCCSNRDKEDGGGDAAGRRRVLRGAQQADFAPHHRRRRGRLRRRRAVPRRRSLATPAGLLYGAAPCAASPGRFDVGATGLHVVPPRRQLRRHQRRWQGVAAAATPASAAEGHGRVHPAVHARRSALQEEGPELERLQGAQGAGAGRGRRRSRHDRKETCLTEFDTTTVLSKINQKRKKEKRATN